MKSKMLDVKTHELLGLMSIVPEVFKEVFIFESGEIEDFDIGFCSFYLVARKDIVVHGHEFFENPDRFAERLREKYSIRFEKPSIAGQEDLYDVMFFEKKMISKPRNLNGDMEEGFAIKPKIVKGLQAGVAEETSEDPEGFLWQWVDEINIGDSETNISGGWKVLNIGGNISRYSWTCMFCGTELSPALLQQACSRCGRLNIRRDPEEQE